MQSDTESLDPKSSKTSQFSVIRRFIGIFGMRCVPDDCEAKDYYNFSGFQG
jgi:hypothetical protein